MAEFAKRIANMAWSAAMVKDLFGFAAEPDVIMFSLGSPADEYLPLTALREISDDIFVPGGLGVPALKYNIIQGLPKLRDAVAEKLMAPKGVSVTRDDVIIVNGGLETVNLVCQLYIEPGDVILVESPTFIQSLHIFDLFEAKCIPVGTDDSGLVPEAVEEAIRKYSPKLIYVIPTFQNPSGRTLTLERRKKIAELAAAYDTMVLEDDPYRDLRYSGAWLPPIYSFDDSHHTIFAGSFSKIFAPGARLGFAVAPPEIMDKLLEVKSATNSHTSTLAQTLCSEFMWRGYFEENLKAAIELCRGRRDTMMECIDKYLPEGTDRVYPDGGLFTWVRLPEKYDMTALLPEAVTKYKVVYVAGESFFAERNGLGRNSMRVSFGNVSAEKIRTGMERLAALLEAHS